MQTPQQPPSKQQKISEIGSDSSARQSAPERSQTAPFGTGMPSGSRLDPLPRMRSISPTLHEDEMELRCNLTTEINIQRMNHRNITAVPLRNIIKTLKKARIERLNTEAAISWLEGTQSNDEWHEEDDLMEIALTKLEKGGRCSRALLISEFLVWAIYEPRREEDARAYHMRWRMSVKYIGRTDTQP
jgi:hypothetical protein